MCSVFLRFLDMRRFFWYSGQAYWGYKLNGKLRVSKTRLLGSNPSTPAS